MQTTKISLANIKEKLSRNEMKNVMAGLKDDGGTVVVSGTRWDGTSCYCDYTTTFNNVIRHVCDTPCPSSNCGH